MSEENDLLYDLLVKKAIYGVDETEQGQLDGLDTSNADAEFRSLELTAAAIGLSDLEIEPMPAHLRADIERGADAYFTQTRSIPMNAEPWPPRPKSVEPERSARSSWFGWLGWTAAAAACVALALNIWFTRIPPEPKVAQNTQPVTTPTPMAPAAQRDTLASTATDLIKATWAAGNVKGISDIVGDIIWSDEKQAGYMTFRGLPANNPATETYQLWIMDENQGDKTPIDGGTFDVGSGGEVVIPINARLKAKSPHLFAVTIERPGGVVVSKREKIAAIAKVETQSKPTS